ncbi:MAG: gliding motility-associated C-terminal domain-containing protein [Bacteroidales bacterium]|nr:gliding motility-associated C-terminal domain-containing protein [Bacteroidales bacterium]
MNDLKNIKDILNNYEVEYNHQDWVKLEKSLPKSGMTGFVKTTLVASAVIIMITTAIFIINSIDKNKNHDKELISQNNTEQIISDNNQIEADNKINNTTIEEKSSDEENNKTIITINPIDKQESDYSNISAKESDKSNEADQIKEENSTSDKTNEVNENNDISESQIIDKNPDLSKLIVNYDILSNCTPTKIIFEAQNVPENCEVVWNTGDNSRITGKKAEYTYNDAGEFFPEVNIIYNNFILKNVKLDEIELYNPTNVKINFDNSENLYYFTCDKEENLDLLWSIDNQEFREREVRYTFNKSAEYLISLSVVNTFGCKTKVEETVKVLIEHIFYLPNAFTPNANGINSEFGPIGENMNFESYQLIIVDGNGKSVFNSNNVDYKWNGKVNNVGEKAKPGIYLWEIKTIDQYQNIQTKKGRVNLIWN